MEVPQFKNKELSVEEQSWLSSFLRKNKGTVWKFLKPILKETVKEKLMEDKIDERVIDLVLDVLDKTKIEDME